MPKPKVKTHEPAPAEKGDAYEGPVTAPANEQPPKADLTHEPIGDGEHKPRSTIAVPLADGSVARYTDEGNFRGVGIARDHPDPDFRPSAEELEPMKEEHEGRKRHHWDKESKSWQKRGIGQNPVAERLDSEDRFEQMVERSRSAIEKSRG